VAVIGGVELPPFRLETEALDRLDPRVEILALALLDRLSSFRIDRSPAAELPDVFDDDPLHPKFCEPGDDVPRVRTLLIRRRLAAARDRMMRAGRRGHQEVEVA